VQAPENATYTSAQGAEVSVKRVPMPGAPESVQQLQIQYGTHQRPGTVVWLPDVPRCWPTAEQIIDHYRHDRDNLGRPFGQRSPQTPAGSGSDGDRDAATPEIPPALENGSDKAEIAPTTEEQAGEGKWSGITGAQ